MKRRFGQSDALSLSPKVVSFRAQISIPTINVFASKLSRQRKKIPESSSSLDFEAIANQRAHQSSWLTEKWLHTLLSLNPA